MEKKGLQFRTISGITRQHMHHMITSGCGSRHTAMLSSGDEQKWQSHPSARKALSAHEEQ